MRRAKLFIAPKVTVTDVSAADRFDTITVAGSLSPYTPPLVPAGLYDVRTEKRLHSYISSSYHSSMFTPFARIRPQRISSSIVGGQFVYRPWLTPEQLELVTDSSRRWERRWYPTDEEHVHCALTWEAITAPMEA